MKTLPVLLLLISALTPASSDAKPVGRHVAGQTSVTNGEDQASLRTRARSAGEVSLDHGLVRAGSHTSLRAQGKDSVALDQGLAVVASRPRFFRPSVTVQTPQHRFQVRGTAQIDYVPGKSLRVAVIEGRMTLSLQSLSREKITLRAGEMLVLNPVEPALPEPLDIDLERLVSTAQLLAGREFDALPTKDLVVKAARDQAEERRDSGGGVRDTVVGSRDATVYARPEELMHSAVAGEIDDLDGDGELDDLDGLDDEDLEDDDEADDAGDADGGDEPDAGGGGEE